MKQNRSKFVRVQCPECKNVQTIAGKPSSQIKCVICGYVLAAPQGGKTVIKAQVEKILD